MVVRSTQSTAATGARTLDTVPLDVFSNDFRVRWRLDRNGGGHCQGEIQTTMDDILKADVSALWTTIVTLTTANSASSGTITDPITAIRYVCVSASGTNNIAFRVLQTGS